jgi:uncharacterized membrane protein
MSFVLFAVVAIFLILAAVIALYVWRRDEPMPPAQVSPVPMEPAADRAARLHALEGRGTELLERRAELDSRRGALGGQSKIFDAFEKLEQRLRAGEITEDEFEAEKIHLLGGR